MSRLEAPSILIVDSATLSAFHLRARLLDTGCNVHVVGSLSAALMIAHRKHVDVVFLEYSEGHATRAFCAALAELDIPHIFTATGLDEARACLPLVNHVSKIESLPELRML
jgi:CheY-like chemotaxis protein